MELWQSLLLIWGSIGVVNGVLLAGVFLFAGNRRPKNIYLGWLVLMLCVRIGKSIYFYYFDQVDRLILQIGLSACLFIGPLFYLYILSIGRPAHDQVLNGRKLLIPLIVGIILIGLSFPYRHHPELWNGLIIAAIYICWLFFVSLALFRLRPFFSRLFIKDYDFPKEDKDLLIITTGIVFITFFYQFAYWIQGFTYLWGSLLFTTLFYYLVFREILNLWQQQRRKKNSKPVPASDGHLLFKQIEQVMEEQKPYKQPALKLKDLAKLTGLHTHLLSQVLNEVYPHGFATYVNEKRIEEAKNLIRSDSDTYTLEGIGYESGFNSKSSFYAVFKRIAGCTPAEYKRQQHHDQQLH